MAISKRLRYEILRRDNHTCRYCGAFAPLTVLVVDHVMPRKHGGSDKPENLVTACQDCNSGKAASLPDPWLTAEVKQQAQEWASGNHQELNSEDLYEMEIYQQCLYTLEDLPTHRALHYIAQAFIAAGSYRPNHTEVIRYAGMTARDEARTAATGVRS